jgi:hypothetical protein
MVDIKTTQKTDLMQWDTAAQILGLTNKQFFGGVEDCNFTAEQLSAILDIGIIKLEHSFNYSPTVGTFYEFGKRAQSYGATVKYIGFFESKSRENARLLLDGIEVTNFPDSTSLIMDFAQTFHNADEFTTEPKLLRAWYD